MNQPPSSSQSHIKPPGVEWACKRDGEIARFELDKLTRSLQLAAAELKETLPADAIAEIARMASFFLSAQAVDRVIAAEEIAEHVEKTLRETAHDTLAQAYAEYRNRKLVARGSLVVADDFSPDGPQPRASLCWDKSRIVQSLRVRLNLDARRSREIASQVERTILGAKFTRLTTDVVRELVNNELGRWDLTERLAPSGRVQISTALLKQQLAEPGGAATAGRMIAGRIWRDFALAEIVSSDVAAAERRGLVRIHGIESPASLAATCLDCATIVRQSSGARDSLARFDARLAQAAVSSSALVALDRIEPWLAMVAEPQDSPEQLADAFWEALRSKMRQAGTTCVLNLYGGFPAGPGLDIGIGPLFGEQPGAREREFAAAVSHELLGRFQRDAADWPGLRVDWHWCTEPDAAQTDLAQRLLRLCAEGLPVAIAFDREPIPLGEGLRRWTTAARPLLENIGISLPLVWRDSGSPRALPALEDGLARAIQLAVRAAVQKREFLRRLPGVIDLDWVDQATLAVAPIGLDWIVQQLVGKSLAEDEGAIKLAETLVRFLKDTSEREARFFALGVVVDGRVEPASVTRPPDIETVEGVTPCCEAAGPRRQIFAASRLHAITQAGTFICPRAVVAGDTSQHFADTIDWAQRSTELVRLRLASDRPAAAQATVTWPEP